MEGAQLLLIRAPVTFWSVIGKRGYHKGNYHKFLPLDEAIASRAVFVIVSGADGRTDGRAETLLEPAK